MSPSEGGALEPRDIALLRSLGGQEFGGDLILPSGKRISAEEAQALSSALAPDVPVNPGPSERIGCLQHGVLDCERCGLLEVRHRLNIESADERSGSIWIGLPVAFAFLLLGVVIMSCFWFVWVSWP